MKIPTVIILLLATITLNTTDGKDLKKEIDSLEDLLESPSRHNGRNSRRQSGKSRKNTPDDYHYEYETKPESYSTSREYKSKPVNYHVETELPPRSYSTSYRNSHADKHDDKDNDDDGSYNKRNRGNSYSHSPSSSNRHQSKSRRGRDDYDDEPVDVVEDYDADNEGGRTRGFSSDNSYNKETKDDYQKSGKLGDDDDSYDNRGRGGGGSYGGHGGRGRSNNRHGGGGGGGNRRSNSPSRSYDDQEDDYSGNGFQREYGDGNNAKSYTRGNDY